MGQLVVRPVEYDEIVDNPSATAERLKQVRRIKCPYCLKLLDFIPPNADLWRHECPNRYGPVFLLNGYAISGASQYNYGEAKETRDKKKPEAEGGLGSDQKG